MHFVHHLMATLWIINCFPWFKRWRNVVSMNIKVTVLVGGGRMGFEPRSIHSRVGWTALCCLPFWPLCVRPCGHGRTSGPWCLNVWVVFHWLNSTPQRLWSPPPPRMSESSVGVEKPRAEISFLGRAQLEEFWVREQSQSWSLKEAFCMRKLIINKWV